MKKSKLTSSLLIVALLVSTVECITGVRTTKQKVYAGLGIGMGALGAYNTYKLWKNHKNRKFSALSRSQRLIELMKTLGLLSSGGLVTYLALRQPGAAGIMVAPGTSQSSALSGGVQSKAKEQAFEQLTPGFDLNTGHREKKEGLVRGFLAPVEGRFASLESYGYFLALASGRMHGLDNRDYFAEPTLRHLQAVVEDKINNRVPEAASLDTLGREVAKKFCERYDKSSYPQLKKLSNQFKTAFALKN